MTSSKKTAPRPSVFDWLGSPPSTTQRTVTQEPSFRAGAGRARPRPFQEWKKSGKTSSSTSTRQRWRVPGGGSPGRLCPALAESAGQLPGHRHRRGRGGHCIPATTSAHPSKHQFPDQEQPTGSSASRRCLADEGSHRASHQREGPRILQSVVPGAQEDRRSATCNWPVHSQPPHGSATLQDGDARVCPFSHQKSGVDGIDRYTRCISSCADASGCSQVSAFRGQQEGVPVHLSSIWTGDFSTGVHQAAATCRLAVKAARCEATRLFRQLADQGRYSGTGSTARPDNHQGAPVSWLDHQLREVRSHTKSRLPVHRDAVLSEVAWWSSPAVLQGLPLITKETEILTDASSSGWGAQLGSRLTQGQWSASQRSCHINVLEMQAVIYAVRDFLPHLRSRVVRLMCDNAATVAYIKNEGGMRSHTLMQMTIRLLKWCDSKAITLVPVHLPGVHNIQADSLSRVGQTLTTEWTMAMASLRPVFAKWGEPQIDLFATFANRRIIKFVSLYPDPRAEWTDAMSMPWDKERGLLYAFPPFKMVPQVLQKIAQSPGVEVILIAQLQLAASWFPELMDLSPRRSDPAVRRRSRPADARRLDGRWGDRDSSLPTVKSTCVETLRAILRAKGHSREAANMSRCLRESSQQVYESHWSRFVAFCRTKRWHVFQVRSHHFSTYMMHLFRDGLLPSTIISHRTSVASVLHHWVYDPAADPHIKLLVRAFRLECPVQRRIMPKWGLHLVLLSLLRPPFKSQVRKMGNPRMTSFP